MLFVLATSAVVAQGRVGNSANLPRQLELRQEVVPYEVERANWSLNQTNGPFLKEPELSPRLVMRRVLRFGKDTNNAFALIWDQPKHKLYLDLNRNHDLTDDPTGVFTSTNKPSSQRFTGVTLPLKTADGLLPATLDLHLSSDAQRSWLHVQLVSRSLWQGRVRVGNENWQVVVADDLLNTRGPAAGQFLLLRPWEVRTNRVYITTSIWGTMDFPQRLFWMGQAIQVERRFEADGEKPVCTVTLTPQQPPSTDLKLSGKFLSYAIFHETNGYMLVLRGSEQPVKVPKGVYTLDAAWLKKGSAEAYRTDRHPFILNANAATNLVLGGPLTNRVMLQRSGRKLFMNRELKGADGEVYNLVNRDRNLPPEFAVYRGGRKVFTGSFQYG